MTVKRDLKSIIRDRQRKTGESYTTARVHVMRERAELVHVPERSRLTESVRVESAVLKVGLNSTARVRILGETGQVTLRSRDVWSLAPGQIATIHIDKRWSHRGDAYVSGKIESTRIDVARLGLEALPLAGGHVEDLRERYEAVQPPDLYAPIWRELTAKPRACFEMHGIAWGAFPGDELEESPTCDAAELMSAGDRDGASELLMETLLRDLRCLDAHAHLGNLVFDRSAERAIVHYEIGMRLGELSLPDGFEGVLPWSALYNRPYLRCLHGYGLCLWRLGRTEEAIAAFERMLTLNPNDNQGARFCLFDARDGVTWDEMREKEERESAQQADSARQARTLRDRRLLSNNEPNVN